MNFWRLQGWLYEALFVLIPHRRLVKETAASISQSTGLVLDAGCGTGRLALYADAQVIGFDFSETMLRVAQQRCNVRRVDLNDRLPCNDATFSTVVSLNVLYTLDNPQLALNELARVLKPGGRLILATPTSSKLLPLVEEHLAEANGRELLATLVNAPRLLAWAAMLAIRGVFTHSQFTFLPARRLEEMVEQAGLALVSSESCYAGIDVKIVARKD